MEGPDAWTTVTVRVGHGHAEVVAARLWAFGPAAIEERDDDGATVLLAGFDDPAAARRAAQDIEGRPGVRGGAVTVATVVDDGLDAWRAHARVERAGPFVVSPAWIDAPAVGSGEVLLRIDPGRTFGSASHPTTRLVLAALAAVVRPGDRVLDVGCGSGILAVAAALLGAATVEGIDVDPEAPVRTAENAVRNGVAGRVTASGAGLDELAGAGRRYDVVLGNLLAPVLEGLAGELVAVARGATLVVSGLLAEQRDRVLDGLGAAAAAAGRTVELVAVLDEDGWEALTLRP